MAPRDLSDEDLIQLGDALHAELLSRSPTKYARSVRLMTEQQLKDLLVKCTAEQNDRATKQLKLRVAHSLEQGEARETPDPRQLLEYRAALFFRAVNAKGPASLLKTQFNLMKSVIKEIK